MYNEPELFKKTALANREQTVQGLFVISKFLCNLGMVLSPFSSIKF